MKTVLERDTRWRIVWPRVWVSVIYWSVETAYFGWHLFPASDAEMVCGGIAVLMLCMAACPTVNSDAELE